MIDSKYHKGDGLTRVHYNGQGHAFWCYVNRHASVDEIMADGFFDLANKNRGRPGQIIEADMVTPGDLIEIEAEDAAVRVRVMSMDQNGCSLTVKPFGEPLYFDDDRNLPLATLPKKSGRKPINVN